LLASTLWLSQSESNITQIRLAKHAKLDIMMTSQVLRTLERKGWLTREPHPTDSRAKIITLTEQGIALARVAIPVVEQIDQDFFASQTLSQHEFNHALQQLIIQGE
jgi:DNA-binding MarR family transcriptional regulator